MELQNYQIEQDYNDFVEQWELTEEKCPETDCEGKIMVTTVGNGPDDYYLIWKCDTCPFQEQE